MTAPNAPAGFKLTEERLSEHTLWRMEHDANTFYCSDNIRRLLSAYKSLAAERDAKDAEIARLTGIVKAQCNNADAYERHLERANDDRDRAEARLAAMATVTEADVECAAVAVMQAACEGIEPSAKWSNEDDDVRSHYRQLARAALEAFVANKTAGGT